MPVFLLPTRLRSYQIAWVLLIALLAVAALIAYTFVIYRNAAVNLLIERDRQVTLLSAARLRDELSTFPESLQKIAREPALLSQDSAMRHSALQRSSAVEEGLFDGGVVLLDSFGTVVAAVPPRPDILNQNWSDRPYFRQLLVSSGPYFSNAVEDGLGGSDVVMVSVPVFGESSQFSGVLVGALRLGEPAISPLYATIVRLRLGQSGGTYVVDGHGNVLFDSESSSVGLPFSESVLPTVKLEPSGGAVRTRDASDNDVVAAYSPIPGTPWTLVIEDDWRTLTKDTRRYLNMLIILLGVGLALPIFGAVLLISSRNSNISQHVYTVQKQQVARTVKDSLLPVDRIPVLPDWNIVVYHREPTDVGGDFYDFLLLPDGCLMLAVGNSDTKSIESGLLFAAVRATLRGVARCFLPPAQALNRANEFLTPETPPETAITCFYGILEPVRGVLRFANAGFDKVFHRKDDGVIELASSGVALGFSLDSTYEERQVEIRPGEYLFLCASQTPDNTDTSVEVLDRNQLVEVMSRHQSEGETLVDAVRSMVASHAGAAWEEENGLTLIVVERLVA